MKKRIIAAALCVVMLVSFTSCGVRVGGFSLKGLVSDILSNFTTVVSSENYGMTIGMMAYYYYDAYDDINNSSNAQVDEYVDIKTTVGGIVTDDGAYEFDEEKTFTVDDEKTFTVDDEKTYTADKEQIYKVDDSTVKIEKAEIDSNIRYEISDKIADIKVQTLIPFVEQYTDDIYMNIAITRAREILTYCEFAREYGIELTESDREEADRILADHINGNLDVMMSGETVVNEAASNDFIKQILATVLYDEQDVITAIEYSVLADKSKAYLSERIEGDISDAEVEMEYEHRGGDINKDSERTKELCYMVFDNRYDAENTIEYFMDRRYVNYEIFMDRAQEIMVEAGHVEDYYSEDKDGSAIDRWLNNGERNVGDITEEPVYDERQDVYYVIYYVGEGQERWRVEIKDELIARRVTEMKNDLYAKHPTSVNYDALETLEYFVGE